MAFFENSAGGLKYMTSEVIPVCHAFTTRFGGVSGGIFQSLNLSASVGDRNENVAENYARLGKALDINIENGVFSNQVHSDGIRIVTHSDCHTLFTQVPFQADGLITSETGLPLFVFAADCTPVLLYDPEKHVAGAIHSGWRGTAKGIAAKAVRMMVSEFGCSAAGIRAAIGPCISVCCYETGREVPEALREALGAQAGKCCEERNGRIYTDLKKANRIMLEAAGLMPYNIDASKECTYCLSDKYWSHRKTGGRRGSQAAVICMKGK